MPPKASEAQDLERADDERTPLLGSVLGAAGKVGGAALKVGGKLGHVGSGLQSGVGKLGSGYGKACGWYDRIFMKDVNREFGDNLELASRAACFTLMCGFPFILPKWVCPVCFESENSPQFYSPVSVMYFLFTLYKSTGDTINFAWSGIMGTLIAVVNMWLMQGFMPGGYTLDGPQSTFPIGCLWGVVFIFSVLWLNFDGNTKIFGLSTFVWYLMYFLDENNVAGFATNFELRLDGQAVKELLTASAGCLVAVLAAFFPYPIFARYKAESTAKIMLQQLHMTWSDFVKYYSGSSKNALVPNILRSELATLQAEAGKLRSYLDSSYFEVFLSSNWQRQRLMLKVLDTFVAEALDRLSSMLQACVEEDFGDSHVQLMKEAGPQIIAVIEQVGDMLADGVDAIENFGFSEELCKSTLADIEKLNARVKELTTGFTKKLHGAGAYKVSQEYSGECIVVSSVCSFAQLTATFTKDLQGDIQDDVLTWRDGNGLAGTFMPSMLFDPQHLQWVARNGSSIIVAFAIGYHGYNKMIVKRNPAIASTVCVLLSKFIGSALTNNLNRLQGVVLGTVVGQLMWALIAWCVWWGYLSLGVTLYVWTLFSCFIYYNSSTYGTVGLLLAVFGTGPLLKGCSDTIYNPTASYYTIINTSIAIIVMIIVDILFSPGRASDMANKNFLDAFVPLRQITDNLFNSAVREVPMRGSSFSGKIASAAALGNEAALEPRYWRQPWKTGSFGQAVQCMSTLRFLICAMECNVTRKENGTRFKEDTFIAATTLKKFVVVQSLMIEALDFIRDLLSESLLDEDGNDVFLTRLDNSNQGTTSFDKRAEEAMAGWLDELKGLLAARKSVELDSFDRDPVAELSMVYSCMKLMFANLTAVHESILAES